MVVGDIRNGLSDAVRAGKVNYAVRVHVTGGVFEFAFGVVLVERGYAVRVNLFPQLALIVVERLAGSRIGIHGLVAAAQHIGVGLGPFAAVASASLQLDFPRVGPLDAAFALDAVFVADGEDGSARNGAQGAVLVIGLDAGAAIGVGGGFNGLAATVKGLGVGGNPAEGVRFAGDAPRDIIGGLAQGDLGGVGAGADGGQFVAGGIEDLGGGNAVAGGAGLAVQSVVRVIRRALTVGRGLEAATGVRVRSLCAAHVVVGKGNTAQVVGGAGFPRGHQGGSDVRGHSGEVLAARAGDRDGLGAIHNRGCIRVRLAGKDGGGHLSAVGFILIELHGAVGIEGAHGLADE